MRIRRLDFLAYGHLRLEGSGPISWHGDLDLAVFRQNRLRADTVAVVAAAAAGWIAFFVAEMLGQLRSESPLDQGLLQLLEKPFLAKQILWFRIIGKKLIKNFRCNRRFVRHVSLPSMVNSRKLAYTSFKTPSVQLIAHAVEGLSHIALKRVRPLASAQARSLRHAGVLP